MKECICPICNSKAEKQFEAEKNLTFYTCPICGRYELNEFQGTSEFDLNHLASYLVYHSYQRGKYSTEYRYNTVLNKDECDKYRNEFRNGNNVQGLPVHMNPEIVNSWYPRTLAERVDDILLYLDSHINHIGQKVFLSFPTLMGALFVDRYDYINKSFNSMGKEIETRKNEDCIEEVRYMLDYLKRMNLIECFEIATVDTNISIKLTPSGYQRIDELQKNSSYGRSVLVAMKFGDETKVLREAIRKGINDANYIAIFIDEVQHNDYITPELLKHIKDSKFVVVDLTHQNSGAYFEEGYAMGLGKPVIQLCKKGIQLHFDIAQKNTIIWENESDISERLTNRIKATIE